MGKEVNYMVIDGNYTVYRGRNINVEYMKHIILHKSVLPE